LIYDLTDVLPREEKYGIVSLARRFASSVAAKIEEGEVLEFPYSSRYS